MSIYVAPSTQFEATATGFPSNLAGTIGVRIVDNTGTTVVARTTSGVLEHPAGSGLYAKTLTSPTVPGQYSVVWDTGGTDVSWAVEELVVQVFPTPPSPYTGDTTARATMLPLIYRVRLMVDDTEREVFTDAEVQEVMDARRDEARYIPLTEQETIVPGGRTFYLTFDAPVGAWEEGVEVVNNDYQPLTPATVDLWNGRWTFTAQPRMPVMIVGFTHDVYGAAADLLMKRAAIESAAFDVAADGTSLTRSQKALAYQQRAFDYLAKARTRSTHLVRTDEGA